MIPLKIVLILLGVFFFLAIATCAVCFYIAFYAPRRTPKNAPEFDIPPGKIYEPHRDTMVAWMKEIRAMPHKQYAIQSHDGLNLYGKFYEYAPGATVELMFHGYRGSAERDLCGGVQRCFSLGHSAFVVDQRTSGMSGGRVITFGLREQEDCLRWVDFCIKEFGKDVKIILTGISMGAATVLMAAGRELPEQGVGILADCGYTSAKKIICKCIRQLHLNDKLLYPFIRIGAQLFGGFDPNKADATAALATCQKPVIFYHGDDDDFVPCSMSEENHAACPAPKRFVVMPGAGHGLCYLVDAQGYLAALKEFGDEHGWN